jgi:hypothetical protein
MKQNDRGYWDVQSFEEAAQDLIDSVKGSGSGTPKNYGSKSDSTNSGSRSWNGRTGEAYDRSAAIYLALDFLKATNTEAAMRKIDESTLIETADLFNAYIHDGEVPVDPSADNAPDALEPPDVD